VCSTRPFNMIWVGARLINSNLVVAFQAAYALGLVVVGRFIDKLGTRLGYALALAFWSSLRWGRHWAVRCQASLSLESPLGFGEAAVFSRQHQGGS